MHKKQWRDRARSLLVAATAVIMISPSAVLLSATPASAVPAPPSSIAWQPCAANPAVDCASITVPLDYANPSAGTTQVGIAREKAGDQANRIGALVFNPGGPGLSGVNQLVSAGAAGLISPEVASRFDVVTFDPRGVDTGISCLTDPQLENYWETTNHLPANNTQATNILNLERTFNQGCVNQNQPLIPHIATANVIRDIEQLRIALNETTFTYFGYSYGTFMGEMYAQMFPGHLRAMVLDGVVDRTISDPEIFADQALASEFAWGEFKSWCQSNTACRLKGQDIDAVLDSALASARANPLPAPRAAIVGDVRPVNDWALTIAVQSMVLYGRAGYLYVDTIIADAAAGDASWARILYSQATGYQGNGEYFPGEGTGRSIRCLDTSWSTRLQTTSDVQTMSAITQAIAPRFGKADVWQGPAQCVGFPIAPVQPPPNSLNVSGQAPALLVSATRDTLTPLKWAAHIATKFDNERLLLRDGNGHTNYNFSTCIKQKVDRYLVDLTLPNWGTVCSSDLDQTQPPPELPPAAAASSSPSPNQLPSASLFSELSGRNPASLAG